MVFALAAAPVPAPVLAAALILTLSLGLVVSCEVPAARGDEMQRWELALPMPRSMVHAITASATGKNTAVRNRALELVASQRTAAAGRIRSQAHRPTAPAFSCSIRGISSSRLSRVKIVQ